MKTILVIGAILFLSILTPHPQPTLGENAAGAALDIQATVPELGREGAEGLSHVRVRDLDTIDGYLWSASDLGRPAIGTLPGGEGRAAAPGWNGGTQWEVD